MWPQIRQTSGDPSAVAPPVPIPNTEVKRCSPDDSASIGCAKVGRCQCYDPASRKREAGFSFPLTSSSNERTPFLQLSADAADHMRYGLKRMTLQFIGIAVATLAVSSFVAAQDDPAKEPSVLAVAKAMPAVVNINTER